MELQIEGVHVTVQAAWEARARHEAARIDRHHPGQLTRLRVRFRPISEGTAGIDVLIDGQMNRVEFDVERQGTDVLLTLGEAFDVLQRNLDERVDRRQPRPSKRTITDELESPR